MNPTGSTAFDLNERRMGDGAICAEDIGMRLKFQT
jgi:hypothetical protein